MTWTAANETIMPNKKKVIDPLPETFASEEEAGEFWDTHSLADYEEFLEPAGITFALKACLRGSRCRGYV